MKYMLLIYGDEQILSEEERLDCYEKSGRLADRLAAAGKFHATAPLHPVATAKSVRLRGGKRLVTDGPFAETHEQLGGYYVVEAENVDEAIAIAEQIPGAAWGTVEVRPILDLTELFARKAAEQATAQA